MIENAILLDAAPAGASAGAGAGMMNIIMIVALIAIFYFFMIRPQNKKQKELLRKFEASLSTEKNYTKRQSFFDKLKAKLDL